MLQLFKKNIVSENDYERMIVHGNDELKPDKETLLFTSTNEPMMPVRLYFKFLNRKNLFRALERRRCVNWENENHFIISYWEEARNMNLDVAYDDVPEDLFPILLANGRIVSNSEIHVDVRSFKRALEIINFLYKYIGPKFLYITHVATYNRYMSATSDNIQEVMNLNFDELFSDVNTEDDGLSKELAKSGVPISQIDNQIEKMIDQPIPTIRKIAVNGSKSELTSA